MGDYFNVSRSSHSARAGYCIISLPMGHIDGLPVGVSFWEVAWCESTLLEIAFTLEQVTRREEIELRDHM